MEIQRLDAHQVQFSHGSLRPSTFEEFVGQESIKKVILTATQSSLKQGHGLGHTLLCGPSGYGKTTLATLISNELSGSLKVITGYAINKPSEMISVLNNLGKGDVLFIDEIHRLKPAVEEVLYVAMEDYCIDMVMPDGSPVRVPLNNFTLVGATTKSESLSQPLKNRFIYTFHLQPYTVDQKQEIIQLGLRKNTISLEKSSILEVISGYVSSTPREITSLCIQIRDFLIVNTKSQDELLLTQKLRDEFHATFELRKGGLSPLHQRYLDILMISDGLHAVGVKTLAAKLGLSEKALETDVEPLLFQLGLIEKTRQGRVLNRL